MSNSQDEYDQQLHLRAEGPGVVNKYFGKRVTLIQRQADLARLQRKSKCLRRVSFNYNYQIMYARGPDRSLRTTINKDFFSSIDNLIIITNGVSIAKQHANWFAPAYQTGVSHSDPFMYNRSWFARIKSPTLHIRLYIREAIHIDLGLHRGLLRSLVLGKRNNSIFYNSMDNRDNIVSIAVDLIHKKSLSTIELNISGHSADLQKKVLELISRSNIPKWHILSDFEDFTPLLIKNQTTLYSRLLQTADFICLKSNIISQPAQKISDSLQELKTNSKKLLTLTLPSSRKLNLLHCSSIINKCKSLKTLCLVTTVNPKQVIMDKKLSSQIYSVRNVVLCTVPSDEHITGCWTTVPYLHYDVLVEDNSRSNYSLKSLHITDHYVTSEHSKTKGLVDAYLVDNSHCRQKMQSLQHLSFSYHNYLNQKTVYNFFCSLKSLIKLDLTIEIVYEQWDQNIPFASMLSLRESTISIKRGEFSNTNIHEDRSAIKKVIKPTEKSQWGAYLVKDLRRLTNLECFELKDNSLKLMELNIFFELLKACCHLTKLKKLILHTYVVREADNLNQDGLIMQVQNESLVRNRRAMEEQLDKLLQIIIAQNAALEIMKIKELWIYEARNVNYQCKKV